MSTKKIKDWEARQIATDIATKAFEHLINPREDALRKVAQGAYDETMTFLHLLNDEYEQKLVDAGVLTRGTFCCVKFVGIECEGDENEFLLGGHNEYDHRKGCWITSFPEIFPTTGLNVRKQEWNDEFLRLYNDLQPFILKRNALAEEIFKQIDGRTCNYVMKEWPEAAPFVIKACKLKTPVPLFKPLENLLARFLPALPAP
jgi:hypothetical protein